MSFGGGFNGGGGGSSYSSGDGNLVADSLYDSNGTSIAMAFHHPHMLTSSSSPSIHHLPIFNSLPLSLAIKPKMEGFNDMGFINAEDFGIEKAKEEEYESRSGGSDNMEGGSGDDQDILPAADKKSLKRKKYHRHTPYQIQELENSFKENPHPDEKARLELGRKLKLESKQVKFWFQNRRTQMKTQMERHENNILKQENDKLRIENITVKEAMRNPICGNCGSPAALGDVSIEQHHLRFENARLKDELNRICLLANKFLGKPLLSLPTPMSPNTSSNLDLAVGRNGFSLPIGLDYGSVLSHSLPGAMPQTTMGMMMMMDNNNNGSVDKSVFLELGLSAMSELVRLAQVDGLLWFENANGHGETLNVEEYNREFSGCIGMKPDGFVTEASRASGSVIISSIALIDILMDSNRWAEMFPSLIGRTSSTDLISNGMGGSKSGALQLMHAEFQVLSPLVPVRHAKFLRFCKQHAEGVWVVADVSIDSGGEGACRRLPSGCIVQDMPNGYSKIIWIEHMEYDERDVHEYFKPLLRSGMGLGAPRWVATLERQCECLAVMMSSTVPSSDHSVISPSGRRSITSLAQRMTRSFCAGVCSTMYKWEIVQEGSSKDAKLMIRKSIGNPGEPSGVVLSATITVWMPVSHQRLFDFLRNEQTRSQWDVLSQDGPVQQMLHIAKGHDLGNNITLLRASSADGITNGNQGGMLLLQETCTDVSGSMIVHAAVDVPAMNVVMSGGDSSCVGLLPSGFAIIPDYLPDPSGPSNGIITRLEDSGNAVSAAATNSGGGGGGGCCLLTVGFQILVNNLPSAKLTMASVDTVNTLISRTVQSIRSNLQCN